MNKEDIILNLAKENNVILNGKIHENNMKKNFQFEIEVFFFFS